MSGKLAALHNDCRNRLSAFSVVYFGAFLLTILSVLADSCHRFTEFANDATSGFKPEEIGTNFAVIFVFELLLLLVFCFHLFRVYISLEMMEADHDYFKEYIEELSTGKRIVELVFRLLIIAVVSLKIVNIFPELDFTRMTRFRDLALFMTVVYAVFFAWDFVMRLFRGKWEKKYAIPDALGFVGAVLLMWVGWDERQQGKNFALLLILVVVVQGFIAWNLWQNFRREGHIYKAHFKSKLWWISGDSKCLAAVSVSGPAAVSLQEATHSIGPLVAPLPTKDPIACLPTAPAMNSSADAVGPLIPPVPADASIGSLTATSVKASNDSGDPLSPPIPPPG